MLTCLRKTDYVQQPWKNGAGVTSQIAMEPEDAKFPQEPFVWRLSTAQVKASEPFSPFPGYQRILIVWEGAGLVLNGKKCHALMPFPFSGDEAISCSLISGPVHDLGIIYKPEEVGVEIEILTLTPAVPGKLSLEEGTHFLFNAKGTVKVESTLAQVGECIRVDADEDDFELKVSVPEPSKVIRISLFPNL
jgi:environmental stress-induced protein Ves